ncbi:MAG: cupin domain-containing protein [Pseudomonadota bacterium]
MDLPAFIEQMPALEIPFPEDVVTTHAIRSDNGLMVLFKFHKDVTLPPHAHKGQWGTVLVGTLELTMNGETRVYGPGESYNIPAGTEHGATAPAGAIVLDIFEEPDRYPLRP